MPIRTFYAECKCQKYVACDTVWDFDLTRWAQKHANECGKPVVIGQCPPNICYSDRIFHYEVVYPKEPKPPMKVLCIGNNIASKSLGGYMGIEVLAPQQFSVNMIKKSRYDAVINCNLYTRAEYIANNPHDLRQRHVDFPVQLAKLCLEHGLEFYQVSRNWKIIDLDDYAWSLWDMQTALEDYSYQLVRIEDPTDYSYDELVKQIRSRHND